MSIEPLGELERIPKLYTELLGNPSPEPSKPEMTVVGTRPTKVLAQLQGIFGAYVPLRLATGEDVFVPLCEIFDCFKRELAAEMHMKSSGGHS